MGSNGVKSTSLSTLSMHKGLYEHVPPVVKLGRFRKPDLHGDEKVQPAPTEKQPSNRKRNNKALTVSN